MLLEIHERIALLEIMPKESDYAGLKALRVARENISLTPEEIEFTNYQVITEGDKTRLYWDIPLALDAIRDIPIDDYVSGVISDTLAALSKKKKLSERYYSVYEKFVLMGS